MSRLGAALIALLRVTAPAGCGDDDADRTAAPRPATATPAPANEIPAELAGTRMTRLKTSELEDPPDDLKAESSDWTLEIPVDCPAFDYAIEGSRLTQTSAETSCTPNSVTSALTARPWERAQ